MSEKIKLTTPKFQVAFEHAFEAKMNEQSEQEEFGCLAMFDKEESDLTELREAIKAAAKEGGLIVKDKATGKMKYAKGFKNPIKDGDESELESLHGHWLVNLTSKYKPTVVGPRKINGSLPEITSEEFYNGCIARASLELKAYEITNKSGAVISRGVKLYLKNLQKVDDGERFGGGSDPNEDFSDSEEGEELDSMADTEDTPDEEWG